MLVVLTYLWGAKFNPDDVVKLVHGINRNLKQRHRIACVTDDTSKVVNGCEAWLIPEADRHLLKVRGCFARLRMFDPQWQRSHGIKEADKIVLIDLDTVVTGPLDQVFDRPEPFVIMQGANAVNPCPFNGALQLLKAGAHPEVWNEFSLEAAAKTLHHEFPDDQGWLWDRLPNAAGWRVGPEHGIYVFRKRGWPARLPIKPVAKGHSRYEEFTRDTSDDLPKGARLVTFINKHPAQFAHLDWVHEHWR